MRKCIYTFLILLIITFKLLAQNNLNDNILFCEQYSKIIDFISSDSVAKKAFPVNKFKLKIKTEITDGIGGISLVIGDYVLEMTGIQPGNLKANDTNYINFYSKVLWEEFVMPRKTINSECLAEIQKKRNKYNIEISFNRKSEQVIFVYARRLNNHLAYSNGIDYLFFFDEENKIRKVYRSIWIE